MKHNLDYYFGPIQKIIFNTEVGVEWETQFLNPSENEAAKYVHPL